MQRLLLLEAKMNKNRERKKRSKKGKDEKKRSRSSSSSSSDSSDSSYEAFDDDICAGWAPPWGKTSTFLRVLDETITTLERAHMSVFMRSEMDFLADLAKAICALSDGEPSKALKKVQHMIGQRVVVNIVRTECYPKSAQAEEHARMQMLNKNSDKWPKIRYACRIKFRGPPQQHAPHQQQQRGGGRGRGGGGGRGGHSTNTTTTPPQPQQQPQQQPQHHGRGNGR